MPLLVKENNSESPNRSTNDSPAESVNGSLHPEDSSWSPAESTNGSLSPRKDSLSVKYSRDRQMAVSSNSLSISGIFNSPQSRRMAVFLLGKQFIDSPGTSR